MATSKMCSYCGERIATDKEHVFPKNLYPDSKAESRVQRMTIPSCNICNNGWSDDEAYFRNILALAGKPNESRRELWETTIRRSFDKLDGTRRVRELVESMRSVEIDGLDRHKVYPGQDERVVRVVKKVVRGLCHHHQVMSAVPESRVWVDVMKYRIPEEFLMEMTYEHREQDIAEYRYSVIEDHGIHSAWLITFFERITFIGTISSSDNSLIEKDGYRDRTPHH
ncbi:MAG: hypothetical protein JRE64_25330 [Deltaproteobacteria bacterium]|nr:hypothetical protein [Deltaproteobacteria bacterium]